METVVTVMKRLREENCLPIVFGAAARYVWEQFQSYFDGILGRFTPLLESDPESTDKNGAG